jgi:hypothetical protein
MFLSEDGSAKLGATHDSLVASILAQKESPPLQLWRVFRDEFANIVDRLKEAQARAAEGSVALQKLDALKETARAKTSRHAERTEIAAAPVKRTVDGPGDSSGGASPLAGGSSGGGSGGGGGSAGAARKGVMSSLRESVLGAAKSPLASPAPTPGMKLLSIDASDGGAAAVAGANPLHGGMPERRAGAAAAATAAAAAAAAAAELIAAEAPAAAAAAPAAAAAADGDYPGLPPGWTHRMTSKGKPLFFNEETGESTYKLAKVPGYPYGGGSGGGAAAAAAAPAAALAAPAVAPPAPVAEEAAGGSSAAAVASPAAPEPEAAASPSAAAAEEVLPAGWASRLTSKGKTMYYHETDGRTSWSIAKIPKD